jgi:hypothetical protein
MITCSDRTSRLKAGFIRPGAVATYVAADDDAESESTPRGTQSPRKRHNFQRSPTSVVSGYEYHEYVFAAADAADAADADAAAAAAANDDDVMTRVTVTTTTLVTASSRMPQAMKMTKIV